jgi:hypothetical protein
LSKPHITKQVKTTTVQDTHTKFHPIQWVLGLYCRSVKLTTHVHLVASLTMSINLSPPSNAYMFTEGQFYLYLYVAHAHYNTVSWKQTVDFPANKVTSVVVGRIETNQLLACIQAIPPDFEFVATRD